MRESLSYPFWKRLIDVTGGIAGIVFFLPFFPIIALAIKIDSKGPVFVKLDRISSGRTIKVYKFRSMVEKAEEEKSNLLHLNERSDGIFFKIKKDPRITRTGRVLRKFRVDEIPQLLNVVKGEMAIVGPRPHEPGEIAKYPTEFTHIPGFRAGMTGMSQISGASSLKWRDELTLDDFYIANLSFPLDLKIILKTIFIFISDPTGV
ncbi:MAG: sugar transferase [Candidatus Colwellbacteria bacterium]|nr:sugar transferase [Candidatus Colwellbacteria bacterium]